MTSKTISWYPSPSITTKSAPRRLILVDLYWTRDKDPRIPLGHASLLAALKSEGSIDVRSIVAPVNCRLNIRRLADEILSHAAGVPTDAVDIGIGAYIWNERVLKRLLPRLRARFGGRIILGGPQVSYVQHGLEQLYPQADVFVRGAAETSLSALVRSSKPIPIPGVHYAGTLDSATQSSTVLGDLPSPLLDGVIALEGRTFLRWETSRGCQFKCSFCQHRQSDARITSANFPHQRIMDEVDLICRAAVQEVAVLDPIFNTLEKSGHAVAVLERFAMNGYRGRLSLQCRAEFINEAFLDAAQKLDVCLEFGLQTIHKDEQFAIDRTNSMDKVANALAEVRRRGIDHEVSLIFGLPQQTLASFTESVRWCLERQVPVIKAFPLLLLRGTKLDLERERWQLVVDRESLPQVVASSTFSRDDWRAMLAISQSLSNTEGRHPNIGALVEAARTAHPDRTRFQPEFAGEAA